MENKREMSKPHNNSKTNTNTNNNTNSNSKNKITNANYKNQVSIKEKLAEKKLLLKEKLQLNSLSKETNTNSVFIKQDSIINNSNLKTDTFSSLKEKYLIKRTGTGLSVKKNFYKKVYNTNSKSSNFNSEVKPINNYNYTTSKEDSNIKDIITSKYDPEINIIEVSMNNDSNTNATNNRIKNSINANNKSDISITKVSPSIANNQLNTNQKFKDISTITSVNDQEEMELKAKKSIDNTNKLIKMVGNVRKSRLKDKKNNNTFNNNTNNKMKCINNDDEDKLDNINNTETVYRKINFANSDINIISQSNTKTINYTNINNNYNSTININNIDSTKKNSVEINPDIINSNNNSYNGSFNGNITNMNMNNNQLSTITVTNLLNYKINSNSVNKNINIKGNLNNLNTNVITNNTPSNNTNNLDSNQIHIFKTLSTNKTNKSKFSEISNPILKTLRTETESEVNLQHQKTLSNISNKKPNSNTTISNNATNALTNNISNNITTTHTQSFNNFNSNNNLINNNWNKKNDIKRHDSDSRSQISIINNNSNNCQNNFHDNDNISSSNLSSKKNSPTLSNDSTTSQRKMSFIYNNNNLKNINSNCFKHSSKRIFHKNYNTYNSNAYYNVNDNIYNSNSKEIFNDFLNNYNHPQFACYSYNKLKQQFATLQQKTFLFINIGYISLNNNCLQDFCDFFYSEINKIDGEKKINYHSVNSFLDINSTNYLSFFSLITEVLIFLYNKEKFYKGITIINFCLLFSILERKTSINYKETMKKFLDKVDRQIKSKKRDLSLKPDFRNSVVVNNPSTDINDFLFTFISGIGGDKTQEKKTKYYSNQLKKPEYENSHIHSKKKAVTEDKNHLSDIYKKLVTKNFNDYLKEKPKTTKDNIAFYRTSCNNINTYTNKDNKSKSNNDNLNYLNIENEFGDKFIDNNNSNNIGGESLIDIKSNVNIHDIDKNINTSNVNSHFTLSDVININKSNKDNANTNNNNNNIDKEVKSINKDSSNSNNTNNTNTNNTNNGIINENDSKYNKELNCNDAIDQEFLVNQLTLKSNLYNLLSCFFLAKYYKIKKRLDINNDRNINNYNNINTINKTKKSSFNSSNFYSFNNENKENRNNYYLQSSNNIVNNNNNIKNNNLDEYTELAYYAKYRKRVIYKLNSALKQSQVSILEAKKLITKAYDIVCKAIFTNTTSNKNNTISTNNNNISNNNHSFSYSYKIDILFEKLTTFQNFIKINSINNSTNITSNCRNDNSKNRNKSNCSANDNKHNRISAKILFIKTFEKEIRDIILSLYILKHRKLEFYFNNFFAKVAFIAEYLYAYINYLNKVLIRKINITNQSSNINKINRAFTLNPEALGEIAKSKTSVITKESSRMKIEALNIKKNSSLSQNLNKENSSNSNINTSDNNGDNNSNNKDAKMMKEMSNAYYNDNISINNSNNNNENDNENETIKYLKAISKEFKESSQKISSNNKKENQTYSQPTSSKRGLIKKTSKNNERNSKKNNTINATSKSLDGIIEEEYSDVSSLEKKLKYYLEVGFEFCASMTLTSINCENNSYNKLNTYLNNNTSSFFFSGLNRESTLSYYTKKSQNNNIIPKQDGDGSSIGNNANSPYNANIPDKSTITNNTNINLTKTLSKKELIRDQALSFWSNSNLLHILNSYSSKNINNNNNNMNSSMHNYQMLYNNMSCMELSYLYQIKQIEEKIFSSLKEINDKTQEGCFTKNSFNNKDNESNNDNENEENLNTNNNNYSGYNNYENFNQNLKKTILKAKETESTYPCIGKYHHLFIDMLKNNNGYILFSSVKKYYFRFFFKMFIIWADKKKITTINTINTINKSALKKNDLNLRPNNNSNISNISGINSNIKQFHRHSINSPINFNNNLNFINNISSNNNNLNNNIVAKSNAAINSNNTNNHENKWSLNQEVQSMRQHLYSNDSPSIPHRNKLKNNNTYALFNNNSNNTSNNQSMINRNLSNNYNSLIRSDITYTMDKSKKSSSKFVSTNSRIEIDLSKNIVTKKHLNKKYKDKNTKPMGIVYYMYKLCFHIIINILVRDQNLKFEKIYFISKMLKSHSLLDYSYLIENKNSITNNIDDIYNTVRISPNKKIISSTNSNKNINNSIINKSNASSYNNTKENSKNNIMSINNNISKSPVYNRLNKNKKLQFDNSFNLSPNYNNNTSTYYHNLFKVSDNTAINKFLYLEESPVTIKIFNNLNKKIDYLVATYYNIKNCTDDTYKVHFFFEALKEYQDKNINKNNSKFTYNKTNFSFGKDNILSYKIDSNEIREHITQCSISLTTPVYWNLENISKLKDFLIVFINHLSYSYYEDKIVFRANGTGLLNNIPVVFFNKTLLMDLIIDRNIKNTASLSFATDILEQKSYFKIDVYFDDKSFNSTFVNLNNEIKSIKKNKAVNLDIEYFSYKILQQKLNNLLLLLPDLEVFLLSIYCNYKDKNFTMFSNSSNEEKTTKETLEEFYSKYSCNNENLYAEILDYLNNYFYFRLNINNNWEIIGLWFAKINENFLSYSYSTNSNDTYLTNANENNLYHKNTLNPSIVVQYYSLLPIKIENINNVFVKKSQEVDYQKIIELLGCDIDKIFLKLSSKDKMLLLCIVLNAYRLKDSLIGSKLNNITLF